MQSTLSECEFLRFSPEVIEVTNPYRMAYDTDQPFTDLLATATVLPIFDGSNVGIRKRHMQDLMLSKDYDAWASTYGASS